jgi:hypothetical protein
MVSGGNEESRQKEVKKISERGEKEKRMELNKL